jgi:cytochrome c553|nr:cobalt-zinc-cadmium resistance protein [Thiomonas sp.]
MVKRLLFVLLMLILSLQAVWAAANAYCQHEQGAATQHFGHHAHRHQAADKSDSGNIPASGFHGDCASCHFGAVGVATSSLDMLPSAPASPAVSPENNFLLSIFLEGPERPKWASAV